MEPYDQQTTQPSHPPNPRARISDGQEARPGQSSAPSGHPARAPGHGGGTHDSDVYRGGSLLSHHWRLIAAMTIVAIGVSVAVTYLTSSTQWEARDLVRVGPPALKRDFSGDPAYTNQVLQTVQQIASDQAVVDAAWNDASRMPALKLNRRGQVKFFWLNPQLVPIPHTDIRNISELEISGKGK